MFPSHLVTAAVQITLDAQNPRHLHELQRVTQLLLEEWLVACARYQECRKRIKAVMTVEATADLDHHLSMREWAVELYRKTGSVPLTSDHVLTARRKLRSVLEEDRRSGRCLCVNCPTAITTPIAATAPQS